MNRAYELMVLVAGTVDLTSDKAQMDFVKKLLDPKVTIKSVTSLGKKQLAFKIKKQAEATYLVAELEGRVVSAEIEGRTRLNDNVLRFLLTLK